MVALYKPQPVMNMMGSDKQSLPLVGGRYRDDVSEI